MFLSTIKFLLFSCCILCSISVYAVNDCPIIPQPKNTQLLHTNFVLNQDVVIIGNSSSVNLVGYLKDEIKKRTGIQLNAISIKANKKIQLIVDPKLKLIGSYQIQMSAQTIAIKAANEEGFFNGLNSLLQLIDASTKSKNQVNLKCWTINDEPRFAWRGFMLDEARHFFGINKVKQLLDWMAYYKLNRFHWHLTDQQGWRLPISKYPKLTSVGGVGNFSDTSAKAAYYTKSQIEEIVAYAKQRYITVIPEIDMPGHATAANKAYPEFNGGGVPEHPNFTFNPGYEKTYSFLGDILKETSTLFPSKMIHLGGDEVEFGAKAWYTNENVKSLMQSKNLTNIQEVEQYFFRRMADTVKKLGSKVLAWDEAVDADLDPANTLIFWWRQDKKAQLQKALDKGFSIILCPRLPMYFDFVQDEQHKVGRKWKEKFNALQNVYEFPSGDLNYQNGLIKGVQANLWTETITSEYRFDLMIFPRIAALAEAAWTEEKNKNFTAFEENLKKHLSLYKKQNINYYDPFERTVREN